MNRLIPQTDLKAAYLAHQTGVDEAVARVMASGWYILGREAERFEEAFAHFCEVPYAVGVASGTDAVELALRAAGVKAGDRVATVSLTAVATVAAIEHMGAIPVLVDVGPGSVTMSPESLERTLHAYGPVQAVVPVHLYGHCADMDALAAVAQKHGALVVEDCAQAHGARFKGRRAGSMGVAGAFSFYPTKNLGAMGDGGAVITTDRDVAERLRLLRQYGWKNRYDSMTVGVNSRLDEMQAAILAVKLEYLEAENSRRRELAALYARELQGIADLELPKTSSHESPVWHLYVVQCEKRDALAAFLKEHGISTGVHYPLPVHAQAAYRGRIALDPEGLPHTGRLCSRVLSLPMYSTLSEEDVIRVCRTVRAFGSGTEMLA